jgi:hypothetical protein
MGDRPIGSPSVPDPGFRRRRKPLPEPHLDTQWRAAPALVMALILAGLGTALMRADLAAVGNLNLPGPVFIPPVYPEAEPSPTVATPRRRVLAVLIDGLRDDVALRQPFLGRLAREGVRAELWADMPTYSAAQWVAALTGVRPADSGVRANFGLLRTPLDNLARRVTRAGARAVNLADDVDWWSRLFGDDWTAATVERGDIVAAATGVMGEGVDLLFVHLTAADTAGHTLGASSRAYLEAARAADEQLRRMALAWGWPEATVIAFSDHGHLMAGGHGGDEPEVRRAFLVGSGPGLRAGARVRARMIDAAPTLAALLGVAAPAQAQGRTLVELLDAPPAARLALAAADAGRVPRVAAAVAAGRRGLARVEHQGRLVRGAAVALCVALALLVIRRARPRARLGLLVGLGALAVTAVFYLAAFHRLSFSADRDGTVLVYSTIFFGFAACALTFAAPLAALATRRLTVADATALSFLAVAGAAPFALAMFVLCGAFGWRFTCEPAWLAVGPLIAYAALTPVALCAATLSGLAGLLALLRSPVRFTVAARARALPSAPPRHSRA